MDLPIAVKVTRYRCPHCARSASSSTRCRKHMARCWYNPDGKGCKTCTFFGVDWEFGDVCEAGVSLAGRPECTNCAFGYVGDWDSGEVCPECNGKPEEIRPGPIVGCDKWESR